MPPSKSLEHADKALENHKNRDSSLEKSRDSIRSTVPKTLRSIFFLIYIEIEFLLGLCIIALFFSVLSGYKVAFDLHIIILSIVILFCFIAVLKLRELKILVKKFTSEHHGIMRILIKHLKRTLSVSAILLGVLTTVILSWGNIPVFYIYLLLLVVLTQALIWYLMLNNIVSHGNFLLWFWFLLLVFFPITFASTEIISRFPLLTGTSRLLNFVILMGGPSISLSLFYNYVGYLSLLTPQEINSTQDLKMKFSKIREISGRCLHLLPEMYVRKIIPVHTEVTPLITLSGPSNCYVSVKKNSQIKFFDAEKRVEVTDRVLTQQFKLTLNLKDTVKTITSSRIKKLWLLVKNFLIYPRVAPSLEKGKEASQKFSQYHVSRRLERLDKKMTYSDYEMESKLMHDFGYNMGIVMAMLSILNEIASVDIATEICKNIKSLQISLKEVRKVLEKRGKRWPEYIEEVAKEMPLASLMPKPPKIEDIEKSFAKLSPILKACKQVN